MSTEYAFDTPDPIQLYVENGSGVIDVIASERVTTTVHVTGKHADQVEVGQSREGVSVIAPRLRGMFTSDKLGMEIQVPTGTTLVLKSGSADITATGEYDAARIKSGSADVRIDVVRGACVIDTGSGDVTIDDTAGEVRLRSGSGDIRIGTTAMPANISTGSGDVNIDRAGAELVVKTGSGDLEVGDATADIAMNTGSGDTSVRTAHKGRISSKAASGDVTIGVPDGTAVWTDIRTVSGSVASRLPQMGEPEPGAEHVEIRAVTVSGDVLLTQA